MTRITSSPQLVSTIFAALLLTVASTAASSQESPINRRLNVLLIVSDDQRPDTIAALGNAVIRTPNLDRLARRGSAFTRAVCAYPICTPSRAEILSGCTVFRNGVLNFGKPLNPRLVLLPEVLRRAGYQTWYCGKWHNSGRPLDHGYQATRGLFAAGGRRFWKPTTDYRGHPVTGYKGWIFQTDDKELLPELGVGLTPDTSRHIADAAIAALEATGDQPFFLHVNFTAPHDPLLRPRDKKHFYNPRQIPVPPNFLPQHPFDHGNLKGRDELLLPFPRTRELVQADLAVYYAVISDLDEQVGRILEALRTRNLQRNTLVIYTSDHGLAVGSHGLRGKQNMYEHTIGVPLLVAGRGIPAGKRFEQQVYLRDIYPTICELTGTKLPHAIDGQSFAQVFRDTDATTYPFTVGYFHQSQRMIRTDRWKLVEYPEAGKWQLFDLKADRYERTNLADSPQHESTRAQLLAMLRNWQRKHGDVGAK